MRIAERLARLEARMFVIPAKVWRTIMVQPWDHQPDESAYDMVMSVSYVRPTDQFGGERVPYERTGIHPRADGPQSYNGSLYRESAQDQAWTERRYSSGFTFVLPHSGREPLEGRLHA
jgi:hypothetical protein